MNFLDAIKAPRTLTPTATVVRQRNGKISVENAHLISEQQQQQRRDAAELAKSSAENVVVINRFDSGRLTTHCTTTQSWQTDTTTSSTTCTTPVTTPLTELTELTHSAGLTILTLNVWFAQYAWEKRQQSLLKQIFSSPQDVVLLQEVTVQFLQKLQQDVRIQQTYRMTDRGNGSSFLGGYGNLILIKRSLPIPAVNFVKFSSSMGRRGLFIQWSNLVISTVHLESLDNCTIRMTQLSELCSALLGDNDGDIMSSSSSSSRVIIAGDFNIAESGCYGNEEENRALQQTILDEYGFEDVGKSLGATYDTNQNEMVQRVTKQPEDVSRYDRILSRGLLCENVRLIGTEKIVVDEHDEQDGGEDVWMSDHFGLMWTVAV